ncbi:alpha/beta fold hydrolase [Candidatus Saganbacteria bacterium]|nr:alpha/beta fold hydrolase [Candidatus Saganbacteria bacterium]
MKKILFAAIFVLITGMGSFAYDKSLWNLPQNINSKILFSKVKNGISINEITYVSSSFEGKPVTIFGYFCYPKKLRPWGMPGVVLVHGGAGGADASYAVSLAKRGYAALSIDLPGHGFRRKASRSTGPDMDVPILFRVEPDLSYNYLYHAVRAARCGITFLEQQSFVNKRIAMVGVSWGGVITLLSNGTDDRLAAAVPVFGSGFLDEGSTWQEWFDKRLTSTELKIYNSSFDARQYLKTQHAPLYYITGTNDHCFYLPNFIRSYQSIEVECTLSLFANIKHNILPNMKNTIFKWVDHKLKGGKGFPTISIENVFRSGNNVIFKLSADGSDEITSVKLFYSVSSVDRWTAKVWRSIKASTINGKYVVSIPIKTLYPEIIFYAAAFDKKGAQNSSPIFASFRIITSDGRDMVITTEPIDKIFEHKLSRNAWADILNKMPDFKESTMPLNYAWKIGKLKKSKDAYYLKINPNI